MKRYYVASGHRNYVSDSTWGPFTTRKAAEECVVALSARPDISHATIREEEHEEPGEDENNG